MRLVFLYGPPAAGKLTVAQAIARLTGLGILHNHLAVELARAVFPGRDAGYGPLVARLRLDAFEAAAEAGVSLVTTFAYAAGEDDAFVARVFETVAHYGGTVSPVQLLPSRAALRARVEASSRAAYSKIADWPLLESVLDAHDVTTPLEGGMTIDNTDLSAEETAARIVRTLRLEPSEL